MTSKILVMREIETGRVISHQLLFDDETTEHIIIDKLPPIEERENEIGHYEVTEQGDVLVVYEEKPKSQLDLIQEQLNQLIQSTTTISEDNLLNMDLIMGTDEKVDLINTKLDEAKGE